MSKTPSRHKSVSELEDIVEESSVPKSLSRRRRHLKKSIGDTSDKSTVRAMEENSEEMVREEEDEYQLKELDTGLKNEGKRDEGATGIVLRKVSSYLRKISVDMTERAEELEFHTAPTGESYLLSTEASPFKPLFFHDGEVPAGRGFHSHQKRRNPFAKEAGRSRQCSSTLSSSTCDTHRSSSSSEGPSSMRGRGTGEEEDGKRGGQGGAGRAEPRGSASEPSDHHDSSSEDEIRKGRRRRIDSHSSEKNGFRVGESLRSENSEDAQVEKDSTREKAHGSIKSSGSSSSTRGETPCDHQLESRSSPLEILKRRNPFAGSAIGRGNCANFSSPSSSSSTRTTTRSALDGGRLERPSQRSSPFLPVRTPSPSPERLSPVEKGDVISDPTTPTKDFGYQKLQSNRSEPTSPASIMDGDEESGLHCSHSGMQELEEPTGRRNPFVKLEKDPDRSSVSVSSSGDTLNQSLWREVHDLKINSGGPLDDPNQVSKCGHKRSEEESDRESSVQVGDYDDDDDKEVIQRNSPSPQTIDISAKPNEYSPRFNGSSERTVGTSKAIAKSRQASQTSSGYRKKNDSASPAEFSRSQSFGSQNEDEHHPMVASTPNLSSRNNSLVDLEINLDQSLPHSSSSPIQIDKLSPLEESTPRNSTTRTTTSSPYSVPLTMDELKCGMGREDGIEDDDGLLSRTGGGLLTRNQRRGKLSRSASNGTKSSSPRVRDLPRKAFHQSTYSPTRSWCWLIYKLFDDSYRQWEYIIADSARSRKRSEEIRRNLELSTSPIDHHSFTERLYTNRATRKDQCKESVRATLQVS